MHKHVVMLEKRFAYFPQKFAANGTEYTVTAIERCWTETARTPRLIFLVKCAELRFKLVQFVKTDRWFMEIPQ